MRSNFLKQFNSKSRKWIWTSLLVVIVLAILAVSTYFELVYFEVIHPFYKHRVEEIKIKYNSSYNVGVYGTMPFTASDQDEEHDLTPSLFWQVDETSFDIVNTPCWFEDNVLNWNNLPRGKQTIKISCYYGIDNGFIFDSEMLNFNVF